LNNTQTYRNICAQHAVIPLFLQPWWLDVVSPGWQAAVVHNGNLPAGIWPYPAEQRLGVQLLRTPLLTPYLGPYIFVPPDMKESKHDGFEHDTIAALLQQLPGAPVWHMAMPPGLKQAGLFSSAGLDIQVKQTFLIDLLPSQEALFANLKDSIRRNIRTAAKEITITSDAAYLSQLFDLQKNTLDNKQVAQAHTLQQMQKLMEACITNNAGALWVAKKGDEVQAIIWNVWDAQTSYYFMGAKNASQGDFTAMSALLWQAISEAKKRGNTIFDMEGSMDPGVERFFRGMGGQRELYMVLKKNTSLLWKLVKKLRK